MSAVAVAGLVVGAAAVVTRFGGKTSADEITDELNVSGGPSVNG